MGFKIETQDGPAKVDGVMNRKSARDSAVEAFMGAKGVDQSPPAVVHVDPAAQAASNTPTASGQLSPEAFTAIQAQHRAAAESQAPQTSTSEGQTSATPPGHPTSEATQQKVDEQPLSPRFAQLARQEKALRARDVQLKAEKLELQKAKEALATREAEMTNKYIPKDRLSKETLAVLAENGIDYDSLTQQALADPADPREIHIAKLEARLAAIEGRQDQSDKSFQDNQTQSYNQAKETIHRDVSRLVKTDPNFETIAAAEAVDDVVELIEKTYYEGLDEERPKGTLLTNEEAATIVEDYLMVEAEKFARLKKIQDRLKATAETSTPTKQPSGQQPQPKPTLTNTMTGAPKKEYSARQRAMFAAQYGSNWQEKVGDKAS